LDELKTQINQYFVHLGENQTAFHVFVDISCIDLGDDKYKGAIIYHLVMLKNDEDVVSMLFWMIQNNKLYMSVRFNCELTKLPRDWAS